jgi:hypothetical protein
MTEKEGIIEKIIEIEWRMFQSVPNIGGTASCQRDRQTFVIMRRSQAASWSEATLESYLADLTEAEEAGRNLLTEKYAWMMKSTSPREYSQIEHLLPVLNPEALSLMESLVKIVLQWEEELSTKYPFVLQRGRPMSSAEEIYGAASVETYLRGELSTYSLRTLNLHYADVMKQVSEGVNGAELILEHTIKEYGFTSLEEANNKLKIQS